MNLTLKVFLGVILSCLVQSAQASDGLVINAAEFGVGKFHRYDNTVHSYASTNAWTPYVLPSNVPTDKPFVQKNADGSFSVFFSTLDELIATVVQISHDQKAQVSVLNIHGHGLPGAMWFPKDTTALNSWLCSDWQSAASGDDKANYDQYYSPVPYSSIMQIRSMSNNPNINFGCTTGAKEWQGGVAKNPDFIKALASDLQVHFLSCVVGLGSVGESFTKSIAALLIPSGNGRVEASMDFGLGDWSMTQGMGFWDYQDHVQLDHDNTIYGQHRQDSEIAQKGTIRMITSKNGQWQSTLLANRDFLPLTFETTITGTEVKETRRVIYSSEPINTMIQVPGTKAFVQATSN
jgi:hypothetical protein